MKKSVLTTECYLTKGDSTLFIHKCRKDDMNSGKYLGVGGHFEEGESPDECMLREIEEETAIKASEIRDFSLRGIVTFKSDIYDIEYIFLFTGEYCGDAPVTPGHCEEGDLEWVTAERVPGLPMWEGDKVFFAALNDEKRRFFTCTLEYEGDRLTDSRTRFY